MTRISKKVFDEIRNILPEVRKELQKELKHWNDHYDWKCSGFHSDERFFETLPSAVYEYIIMVWDIKPDRIDKDTAMRALNGKILKDVHKITAHALRRLAFVKA